jgi:uncharacterized protein (DUF934 family)
VRYNLKQLELVPVPDEPADAVLKPADAVETLVSQLHSLRSIAIEFPGPSEGRGYTQARVLRERLAFKGELRAVGHVKRDQILFMVGCGFDSFELAAGENVEGVLASLRRFTVAYAETATRPPARRTRFRARGPA